METVILFQISPKIFVYLFNILVIFLKANNSDQTNRILRFRENNSNLPETKTFGKFY